MLSRRVLLKRTLIGVAAGLWGGIRQVFAQGEGAAMRRENCSFVGDVQARLARAIARNELPAGAEELVVCPLCGDRLRIGADFVR